MKKILSFAIGLSVIFSFATHIHAAGTAHEYMNMLERYRANGEYNTMDFTLRRARIKYPDEQAFDAMRIEYLIGTKRYDDAVSELAEMNFSEYQKKLLEAKVYARSAIQGDNKADFYKAHDLYQEIINAYPREKQGYEDFIDLLFHIPAGWSVPKNVYRSSLSYGENVYEPKRTYKKDRPFLRYDNQAYKYVENPLFEIDVIVNKAHTRLRADTIKYDKAWLSGKYVELAKSILSMEPDNPSPLLDRALIYADRALDLDRSNIEAISLRNTFRYHVK